MGESVQAVCRERRGCLSASHWSWVMLHPVFWASAIALVLNDRLLKWSFPGLVTGKLSDVAGVVMVAVVLVALSGRVRLSLVVTGVLFTLLKTVPGVAVWAIPVLGGRTLTDPTDVIAVAALVPLGWWLWRRRDRADVGEGSGARTWGTAAKIGGVFVAVLATSATSCYPPEFEALGVAADGSIIQASADGSGQSRLVLPVESTETTTGGDYLAWGGDTGGEVIDVSPAATRACTNDNTCVEIRGLSIIEIGPTGEEEVVLDYNDRRGAINSQLGSCASDLGEQFPDVVSNGEVVVVAMGPIGAMVRTEQGEWLPTGNSYASPSIARDARVNSAFSTLAIILPTPAAIAGILFVIFFPTRTWARVTGIVLAVVFWLVTMFAVWVWMGVLEGEPSFALAMSVVGSFAIVATCLLLGLLARKRRPPPMLPMY